MRLSLVIPFLALALRARAEGPDVAAVDRLFATWNRPGSPGCALGVMVGGSVVFAKGYGLASLAYDVPITPDTTFDVASISKQLTATVVLLLAEEKRLSLDDDLRKFVPELPKTTPPIVLRHLLHHTSGLPDYLPLLLAAGFRVEDVTTDREALGQLVRQRELVSRPGEEFAYNNSGYFLLSQVVRRVSGKTLGELLSERVFTPLGMSRSLVADDHRRVAPGHATGYARVPDGFRVAESNWEQVGDGGVVTSVNELLRWARELDEPKTLSPATVALLERPGSLANGKKLAYGLGLFLRDYRGLPTLGHGGAWAGFRSELLRIPSRHLTVACLCNVSDADPGALARQVVDLTLGLPRLEEAGEPVPTAGIGAPAALDPASYVGLYRNARTGVLRRIYSKDGKLRAGIPGTLRNAELVPLGGGAYRPLGVAGPDPVTTLRFEVERNAVRLRVTDDERSELLEPVLMFHPASQELASYVGDYYSDALRAVYRISLEDGRLFVRARGAPDEPLEPTFLDAFALPGLQLIFERDARKRPKGFQLSIGRIRGIRFTKLPPAP